MLSFRLLRKLYRLHEARKGVARSNLRQIRLFGTFLLFATFVDISSWYYSSSRVALRDISSATQQKDYSNSQHRLLTTDKPLRILYLVTSLAEYNNGRRFTKRGDDRVVNYMMPVLTEGVESMLSFGYQVDVYLICHWKMTPVRRSMIRDKLPSSVGLEVWDDATPLGYRLERNQNYTDFVTRGLARQHRYVIKVKFADYDFFVAFEDDMLVKGDHVKHYLDMTNDIARLRALAPDTIRVEERRNAFHGPLSKTQLSRMIPGFIRVEVLRTEDENGTQIELDPIPVDLEFDGKNRTVDPRPCCLLSNKTVNDHIPPEPTSSRVFVWETGIKGLSVCEVPTSGWVALLGGSYVHGKKHVIGDYWSGRDGAFGSENRPLPNDPRFLNNQGGWMATRQQIWEWHTEHCPGGFLPPFDSPHYDLDGLNLRNVRRRQCGLKYFCFSFQRGTHICFSLQVEYWSGGVSIFSFIQACNMQRIVSLDPDGFSRHLVYHSANNKQKQLRKQGKSDRFVKVDDLLGQLNTVRKRAEDAKRKELEQK